MKKIAIIGSGPTGIYTFFALLNNKTPLSISVFEQEKEAGVGMPYSVEDNSRLMLANIASIEIPPIFITYLDWLKTQSQTHLARYGVDKTSLHDRQFLPRILLGEYFRDRFLAIVAEARKRGFEVQVYESTCVTDIDAHADGVALSVNDKPFRESVDLAIVATGHVWPDDDEATRAYFPSPWSGLMDAKIRPCRVGIMGTSLSGLDAAMAVVMQHGTFVDDQFRLAEKSQGLKITLMSRTGILPEADFYCPIPYEPLAILTPAVAEAEIKKGANGLLDRIFALMVKELRNADPQWCDAIALHRLNADTLLDAWFADRKKHDPFLWAEDNLQEVVRNKHEKRTVAWRYTVLRLHDVVGEIVPHLNEKDSERFKIGLARVFIDNYAAIPPQSIRRLLALREAGIISVLTLGNEYELNIGNDHTVITTQDDTWQFDVFIDARGQKPLKTKDLPFPTLRKQLLTTGDEIPDVGEDYTLQAPESQCGRVAFGAIPWLMHDQPFVQGLAECAERGKAMAKAAEKPASRPRRKVFFAEN
ncbi:MULTISPECIES: FAD-NAD(P)-binding protein [Enterobacter]|uniref:FAD-NAD(P)-binding protein n=1 Tax=Enterobacter TaxID=547 RepID=UPI0028E58188|nr:FAD-NAD(P)-binding protein [Enterobacter cloacae]WNT38304.1 FAD-NAD(P)-binding protein [Enterobacter cloacae]HDR2791609.1 FAD-NAD(P)-binding protein [Enterobacter asburiae]HDR2797016.1 FAD-NAD(P)-binding protein [Enterobacter asburiae]